MIFTHPWRLLAVVTAFWVAVIVTGLGLDYYI